MDKVFSLTRDVVFFRTRKQWGPLSNIHARFPFLLGRLYIGSSEHLYQALRLPLTLLQEYILAADFPMGAKRRAYEYDIIATTIATWDHERVHAMRVVLALKTLAYTEFFKDLFEAAAERQIVERSSNDPFWGAVLQNDNETLIGKNLLGELWMEVIEHVRSNTLEDHLKVLSRTESVLTLYDEPLQSWLVRALSDCRMPTPDTNATLPLF
jgi:ribA/ribD-fused uncharacterized protein